MAYVGSITVGAAIPVVATALVGVQASADRISAELSGALALQASMAATPPTFAANLSAAQDIVASLLVAVDPGVDFQVAAIAEAVARLQAELAELTAALAISIELATPGVHLYRYTAPATSIPGQVQSDIGAGVPGVPAETPVDAWLLVASDGSASASLSAILKSS